MRTFPVSITNNATKFNPLSFYLGDNWICLHHLYFGAQVNTHMPPPTNTHAYTQTRMHTHKCLHAYTHAHTHTQIHAYTHAHTMHTYTNARMCTHLHIHTHRGIYKYTLIGYKPTLSSKILQDLSPLWLPRHLYDLSSAKSLPPQPSTHCHLTESLCSPATLHSSFSKVLPNPSLPCSKPDHGCIFF